MKKAVSILLAVILLLALVTPALANVCIPCRGDGSVECFNCKGKGTITQYVTFPQHGTREVPCPYAPCFNGRHTCFVCSGRGTTGSGGNQGGSQGGNQGGTQPPADPSAVYTGTSIRRVDSVISQARLIFGRRSDGGYYALQWGNMNRTPEDYISYLRNALGLTINRTSYGVSGGTVYNYEALSGSTLVMRMSWTQVSSFSTTNPSTFSTDIEPAARQLFPEGGVVTPPPPPPPTTPDLTSASSWARPEITSAHNKGLVTPELMSGLRNEIRRGEFVRLAMNYLRVTLGMTNAQLVTKFATNPNRVFTDVPNDACLQAAGKLGITSGTSGTEPNRVFGDGPFDREMAAFMLRRVHIIVNGGSETVPDQGYSDMNEARWHQGAVNYVIHHNIMQGTDTARGIFSPRRNFTRQESIAVFDRMGGAPPPSSGVSAMYKDFPDVPDFGALTGLTVLGTFAVGSSTFFDYANISGNEALYVTELLKHGFAHSNTSEMGGNAVNTYRKVLANGNRVHVTFYISSVDGRFVVQISVFT